MKGTKKDLINYRLLRAKDTLDDKVMPYFKPVNDLIGLIENIINK